MFSALRITADSLIPGVASSPVVQLELAVLAVAAVLSLLQPRLADRWFQALEQGVVRLSARPWRSILVVAAFAVVLRLSLLPVAPVPVPEHHDEFSYLLAADTFVRGRLANPTHSMWMAFHRFYIQSSATQRRAFPPGL